MGRSKTPGVYGFARGRVGAVVYTTTTNSITGERKQILRLRPESVKNPNTTGQILQRMKLGPAQKFYNAFEKVVANGIMSHSFEGVEYGNKSRLRFMQLALAGDPKVYVPKGINYFVPGEFQVSDGSLAGLEVTDANLDGGFVLDSENALTAASLETILSGTTLQVGDQITVLGVIPNNDGTYMPVVARIVLAVGNKVENTANTDTITLHSNGRVSFAANEYAAGAAIVSRGTDPATAQRSTAVMQLFGEYKNLLSAEALEAAIASYRDDVTYNSFNSDWYLNNSTSQAFNGRVAWIDAITSGGENLEMDNSFLVGQKINGSNLEFVVFTSDGTANGQTYFTTNNSYRLATYEDEANTPITGAQLRAGLLAGGLQVSETYVKLTDEIAAQGGFSAGNL